MKCRVDFLDGILTAALTFFCIILWGHAHLIQDTNQLCPGTPEPKINERGITGTEKKKKREKKLMDRQQCNDCRGGGERGCREDKR